MPRADDSPFPPERFCWRRAKWPTNCIGYAKDACVCFCNDGKDITFQFFFEGDFVASFDSLYNRQPSLFSLESIEPAELSAIEWADFYALVRREPSLRRAYEAKLVERFRTYQLLFLSRIKNTPRQRYEELLKEYPDIARRVPQHYIASYLGITPVSLSRIRNRR